LASADLGSVHSGIVMTSNTVAIVIACISGGISFAIALFAEWGRPKLAAWQHKRTVELEGLRCEQAQKLQILKGEMDHKLEALKAGHNKELEGWRHTLNLELQRLRSDQDKELEVFRHTLQQRREQLAKEDDVAKLVARYSRASPPNTILLRLIVLTLM
jgi:hypothetical protein